MCENCMEYRPNIKLKQEEFTCPECNQVWVSANVWPGNYWEPKKNDKV